MEVSSRRRNALLTALGVLVALVVVAIAARGSIPTGEGGTRRPSQALIDILFTLYLLVLASSVALAIYLVVLRRQIVAQGGSVARRTRLESLLIAIVLIGAASVLGRRIADQNALAPPVAPQLTFQNGAAGRRLTGPRTSLSSRGHRPSSPSGCSCSHSAPGGTGDGPVNGREASSEVETTGLQPTSPRPWTRRSTTCAPSRIHAGP